MAKLTDLNILDIGNTIQLAGAVYSGKGKTYLLFFPDEQSDLPVENLELNFQDWQAFMRQTDLLETEIIEHNPANGDLVKIVVRKSQRQIEQNISWRVFRRDGYSCRYCGMDDVPLTVDHLICWEEGGPSTEANLVSSCRKCNRTRGNTPYAEWLRSDWYKNRSRKLSPAVQDANQALVATLHTVPRQIHKRSR